MNKTYTIELDSPQLHYIIKLLTNSITSHEYLVQKYTVLPTLEAFRNQPRKTDVNQQRYSSWVDTEAAELSTYKAQLELLEKTRDTITKALKEQA